MKRIVITGACGQIAYSLIFKIANGDLFGQEEIALHLLEVKEMENAMHGLLMEIEDCCFPLLKEVKAGFDPLEMFNDVDVAILVGAKPRGPGMERKDLLLDNGKIFLEQGKALNKVAKKDVKILVVGNPCNTNCLIAMHNAPNIPKENFYAMTRLDQNRAQSQLAKKASISLDKVSNVTIWGNHSTTQVPDFMNALIDKKSVLEVIKDKQWLENTFMQVVQKRGSEIIAKRGKSSAASAAQAIVDTLKSLYTSSKKLFSLAVCSDKNSYGIKEDLIFSFPCFSLGNGRYKIIDNIKVDNFLREKITISEKELLEEKSLVKHLFPNEEVD
jgi:malate dehydrogenase